MQYSILTIIMLSHMPGDKKNNSNFWMIGYDYTKMGSLN
jgi:hypothetical protein